MLYCKYLIYYIVELLYISISTIYKLIKMKKLLLILIISTVSNILFAQIQINLKGIVIDKIPQAKDMNIGDEVEIIKIIKNIEGYTYCNYEVISGNNTYKVEPKHIDNIRIKYSTIKEYYKSQAVLSGLYEKILENGYNYDIRAEAEEDALEYLKILKDNGLLLEDSYLEDYLYQIIGYFEDIDIGLDINYNLDISILIDNHPQAFIFPNGTIVLSTGLLSIIESEEELISVLGHEISHFVLDHSIMNILYQKDRQKKAEFWAGVATLATGVLEATVAVKAAKSNINIYNSYYQPGDLMVAVGAISFDMADMVVKRLGLKYSSNQESQADTCSRDILKLLGMNSSSLSNVLDKINTYQVNLGDYSALSGESGYPTVYHRIEKIGPIIKPKDSIYNKRISSINTITAQLEYFNKKFDNCIDIIDKNINANVATEYDYLLKAKSLLKVSNSKESNLEALKLLNTAENLNLVYHYEIPKIQALIYIRLKNKIKSKEYLNKYRNYLESLEEDNEFIINEIIWCKTLEHKINNGLF